MTSKKSPTKKSNPKTKAFLVGAAIGAVGGAIAGVLTAPKSGKDTRADIGRQAKKATTSIKKTAQKVTKRGNPAKKASDSGK